MRFTLFAAFGCVLALVRGSSGDYNAATDQEPPTDSPTTSAPNDTGLICCQALTIQCEACKAEVSPEQYCIDYPTSSYCSFPTDSPTTATIDPTDSPTTATIGGCCKAYSVECLACVEGIPQEEYCATHSTSDLCSEDIAIEFKTNSTQFELDQLKLELESGDHTQAQVNWIITRALADHFSQIDVFDEASFIAWSNSTGYKIYNATNESGNYVWYPVPMIGTGIEWISFNSTTNITSYTISQLLEGNCTANWVTLEGVKDEFKCSNGWAILYSMTYCFLGSSPSRIPYECSCDSFGCKFPIAPTDQEALAELPATDDSPTPLIPTETTETPTVDPTNRPTDSPTETTETPTADPTNRPTDSPTETTETPTKTTESPTVDPTNRPTDSPTKTTESPTKTTESPTVDPTNRPTDSPTGTSEPSPADPNATRTTGTVSNDHKPWSEHHWYVYLIAGVAVAAVIVIAIVVYRKRKSGGAYSTGQPYEISIERLIF